MMQLLQQYVTKLASKEIENSTEALKIINLHKIFKKEPLFSNFNLTINKGKIVGVVGPNGSGKTTLIKIIAGFIIPDAGKILINGLDMSHNHTKIMNLLGVLLDGTRCLYWRLSAWQNLVYFCGLKHIFGKDAYMIGEQLFKTFNLCDIKEKRVEVLSHGQRRRLALVCAVVHNPTLILMDEPTNGLDSESKEILENWIRYAIFTQKKSILISSHDKSLLENFYTDIVSLDKVKD